VRSLVDRMRALEHRVHDRTAARREEFDGGVAYSNRDLRAVWDLNFLRLDRPCTQPALWADRLQAGLGHRRVLVEDPHLVARFGPGLRERGFAETELVALARPVDGGGALDPAVRELAFEPVRALRRQVVAEQLPAAHAGVIDQVVDASALAERAGARWLVCFDGDAPVAHCVVFSHDGLAQIEDVATLERHRRRGFARRLIAHALTLLARDHDTAFLTAEAQDWPLGFYERLGFVPIERRASYLLIVADP
jgi:ribosomal protein S18 acetylase RimI-like enzyme